MQTQHFMNNNKSGNNNIKKKENNVQRWKYDLSNNNIQQNFHGPAAAKAGSTVGKPMFREVRSTVQKFPAWHTKAAPNGKCCEGYIVPSMVRLMYQLESVLK